LQLFAREQDAGTTALTPANLLLLGKTGVGKSTLVNAMLRRPLAATGIGRPVTATIHEYGLSDLPVTVFDSPGLELGERADSNIDDVMDFIESRQLRRQAEQIHLSWYCIHAQSSRIDEREIDLIVRAAEMTTLVLVLTQCLAPDDPGVEPFVRELEHLKLPLAHDYVIKTLAFQRSIGGVTLKPFGLQELAEISSKLMPEAQRSAFINGQVVLVNLKMEEARKLIPLYCGAAAAVAAMPLPTHSGPLGALQMTMCGRLSAVMGVDDPSMANALARVMSGTGAASLGRSTVAGLLRLVPGAGAVASGVISASVAAAITAALGEAYIQACSVLVRRRARGETVPDAEILNVMEGAFRRRLLHWGPSRKLTTS
jgi:uncharacterized protein (DUF697 family)